MIDPIEAQPAPQATAPEPNLAETGRAPCRPSTTSKSDSVTKLLRRAKGATLAEVQEATGWQPHSVRAFLSGLRKKGWAVSKEQRKSGETAYRIPGKAAAVSPSDA